jgi:hypothetical protein
MDVYDRKLVKISITTVGGALRAESLEQLMDRHIEVPEIGIMEESCTLKECSYLQDSTTAPYVTATVVPNRPFIFLSFLLNNLIFLPASAISWKPKILFFCNYESEIVLLQY